MTIPAIDPAVNRRTAEDSIVERAVNILKDRLIAPTENATLAHHYFAIEKLAVLSCAGLPHEEFKCMFFNAQYRFLTMQTMGVGTLTECPTYPREFARAALNTNASFVILVHNHPGGTVEPSQSDIKMTDHIQRMFEYIDVTLCDHLIVAGTEVYSMHRNNKMQRL